MQPKLAWLSAGVLALAAFITLGSQLGAQRPPAPDQAGPLPGGRFVVARVVGDSLILLDSATGELYRAGPEDVKPYSAKPKPLPPPPPPEKKEAPERKAEKEVESKTNAKDAPEKREKE